MGIFDFLTAKKPTANVAKDRLRIIVAQERSGRGAPAPDYMPMLERDLLEVIRRYVPEADSVKVDVIGEGDNKVLDISVALPESPAQPS